MTNKIIISSLTSILLLNSLSASNILKKYECGQTINNTSVDKHTCKIKQIKQEVETKISKITNYQELYQKLNIFSVLELYQSKKSQNFLKNIFINDYTLTYLLYKKVVNFKNKVEDDIAEYSNIKNNFITQIDLGGEFITLIHIKTNSLDDYKNISKKINKKVLTLSNIETFKNILLEIEKSHEIKIKNYITENLSQNTSNDLKTLFQNINRFEDEIRWDNEPIAIYHFHDKKSALMHILDYYYYKNNLYYLKTHPQEFKKTKPLITYAKELNNIQEILTHKRKYNIVDSNNTINKVTLPTRYNASLDFPPVDTVAFSFTIKKENIQVNYPRINKNIKFNFSLKIREDITRKGKVIIETIHLNIKENNKVIADEENSYIKLDTFVNYPKVLFSKITNNTIGSIDTEFTFDKYEQERKIKGVGLIKEAICGYKIEESSKNIVFRCKEIKLKALNIEFKHK